MSPRTEEQYEEIRQEKRQLIMNSALELFATHSFESTTISQIAKHAGISKGLLYNYFKSKDELVEEILNKGFDEIMELFDPNHDGILEPHEMKYYISESLRTIKENHKFWKLYWSVSFQPSVHKYIQKKMSEFIEPVMKMITSYLQHQGFENPTVEAFMFGALLDGISLGYVLAPDLYPIDVIEKEIINKYCNTKTKES